MGYIKFSGVLEEIFEKYPNINIFEFLREKLQLPDYKAEELAVRIEKIYLQEAKITEQKFAITLLEKPDRSEVPPRTSLYSVESISEMEFEHFIKWLLTALDYEIYPEKNTTNSGVSLVASKDSEKIAIQAKKCPKNYGGSNSIIFTSNEAKLTYGCKRSIAITTSYFTQQARADAEKLGVELWDKGNLAEKITEIRKKADIEEQSSFPPYKGSLLQSLLRLEETKDFIIEPKAEGKYDLHLPGVKYPLLTFQARNADVIRCVCRIKYNEPVGEFDGDAIIKSDRNNNRFGPDGIEAYSLIIQYLEQFVDN